MDANRPTDRSERMARRESRETNQTGKRHDGRRSSGGNHKKLMNAVIPTILDGYQQAGQSGCQAGSATSGDQQAPAKKHKLKQRFTVIRKLGKGTYGRVNLAVNKETGQEVAIKTIKKTKIDNEQDLERVRREIQIMTSIEHPHIIHIYEVFENKDKIVLVMQYAPGGELYEYVSQSKVLDEQEARRLFRQIATAIYYCHQNKICHRDLKLENILLDEKNNAKLADFGLSNVFDKSRQLRTFCGSPLYASPEIVQGSPYEGPEVDCWSLGVLLYTLVYGAMPFDGSNFKRLVKQISEASYYEPEQKSQASPLIGKLLCADPARRASIRDICLDPWVNGQATSSPVASPPGAGLRLSPSSNPQLPHHPPLLKVAQDMANLTPVRLDILLALTPACSEQVPAQQTASNVSDASRDKENIQPANEPNHGYPPERPQLMDHKAGHFGSDLMEIDDAGASSPIASYVVRNLAPNESEKAQPVASTDVTAAGTRADEMSGKEEKALGKTEVPASELTVDSGKEPGENIVVVQPETTIEVSMNEKDEAMETERISSSALDSNKPENNLLTTEQCDEAHPTMQLDSRQTDPVTASEQGRPTNEVDAETEPCNTDFPQPMDMNEARQQSVAETKVSDEPEPESESAKIANTSELGADSASDGKPKRVKKRVVIVKKKKKVSKKENEEQEQSKGNNEDKADDTAKLEGSARAESMVKGPNAGPRKVRIPETFQVAAEGTSVESPVQPKQVATRRQSALIADVSQKLLLQQQLDVSQATSSMIEMDQHQLVSVRVSDTKSEFERRASLAATTSTTPSSSVSPKSSERNLHDDQRQQETNKPETIIKEPTLIETRKELVSPVCSTTIAAEPVIRLQPIEVQQARVVAPPSEPQTSTNSRQALFSDSNDTLAKCADLLSVDDFANRDSSTRSDSVETIKDESQEASKADQKSVPDGGNIRSCLEVSLRGGPSERATMPSTSLFAAGSLGPAPITRSYKKVTFTKDGTCVTETGRIYSTQADDGTVRHIERKSKVTHYPSESDGTIASADMRAAETTHEEIVFESSSTPNSHFWHHDGPNQPANRQLKRLVMPLDEFCNDSEQPQGDPYQNEQADGDFYRRERAGSGSSCSSGSTDVFDDLFDTWTGAISMFNQGRHLDELRSSLMNRAFPTGSPVSFGRQASSLMSRHAEHRDAVETHSRPQSSGASFFPDDHWTSSTRLDSRQGCGSANVTGGDSLFGFGVRPRRHRHRHQRSSSRAPSSAGRGSAGIGDYDGDPFERPASVNLGSAKGRFGSSNLYPRRDDLSMGFERDEEFFASDWPGGGSLLEKMELEHEMLRRRFAQQRRQLWKGSTPSIHEIPAGREQLSADQSLAHQSGSNSSFADPTRRGSQQQERQSRDNARTSILCHTNLRQSAPLDSTPMRRNTANLADHLPPRQTASVGRSASKTSLITSRLASIQLGQPDDRGLARQEPAQMQQKHKSASFIELKRNSSSTSSKLAPEHGASRPPHNSNASLSSQSNWVDQLTPTCCSNATGGGPMAFSDNNLERSHAMGDKRGADANSRIQSWLLQSSGNLSVSSGSKSSTSDATLPSSSGRSDSMAAAYLASSAGQMPRDDDSLRTTSVPGQSGGFRHHQRQHSTRTIIGQQLPPLASRSPSGQTENRMSLTKSPRPGQPISMIVRSTSRQSMSELNEPGRVERRKVYETVETIMSGGPAESNDHSYRRAQQSATSSAQISSKVFAFPVGSDGYAQQEHQKRGQIVETRMTTTSSKQVFSQGSASPALGEHESWEAAKQTSGAFTEGVPPAQLGSTRPCDDFNDFDSLIGSGAELDSHSSSSLLDQLRSRGYRSIMNQRLVGPAPGQQRQQTQTTTPTAEPDIVTSSSNSMMTMSSSGVGCGPAGVLDDSAVQAPAGKHHQPAKEQRVVGPSDLGHTHSINQSEALDVAQSRQGTSVAASELAADQHLQTGPPLLARKPETVPSPCVDNDHPQGQELTPDAIRGGSTGLAQGEDDKMIGPVSPELDELDEDVREAKANVKEYLDRIRETEKFIKSMHEEEEKLERHRRESFLFNNLILSTKLNGIKGERQQARLFELGGTHLNSATCGPFSAPVTMMNGNLYDLHPAAETTHTRGSSELVTGTHTTHSGRAYGGGGNGGGSPLHEPSVSCFSSDLFRPISFAPEVPVSVPTLHAASHSLNLKNPLEPIQPVSMQSYAPAGARWHRSKSQLGDQFYGDSTCLAGSREDGRPFSAHVMCAPGNPYFPSRHRRSASQIRYQPTSAGTTCSLHASLDEPASMMSEYRSSFGPNLSQERRQPRHQSLAPCHLRSPRAISPIALSPNSRSDYSDDLDMSAYRASSYVAKVVPETPSLSRGRDRTKNRLSSIVARGGSISRALSPIIRDKSVSPPRQNITRRRSMQQTFSGGATLERDDSDGECSPARRKSWTSSERVPSTGPGCASRLSELEQRLQANKRRREELLKGINSPDRESRSKLLSDHSTPNPSKTTNASDGEADDEPEQSCGFERPAKRVSNTRQESAPESPVEIFNDLRNKRPSAPISRFRASRLESMEARIKRRSYCVRVKSPERVAGGINQ